MQLLFTKLAVLAFVCSAIAAPSSKSSILDAFNTKAKLDILVSFKGADVENVRKQAKIQALGGSRASVIQSMYNALTAHAESTQSNVLKMLRNHDAAEKMKVRSLWITNQVGIKGADKSVVTSLLGMEEVANIIESPTGELIHPVNTHSLPENYVHAGEQWGVQDIEAPSVWEDGNQGQGVVVGSIDTGCLASHEALKDAFLPDHSWYDPAEGDLTPTDGHGHGTHTIGIMAGRNFGIGVAPEAKFIACKGFDKEGKSDSIDIIECGQFMLCPSYVNGSNPRCDLAPVAVGNSWGFNTNPGFFDSIIHAWIDAGIAPVFAAGNEGGECQTLRYPGDHPDVITVGASDYSKTKTNFSSAGPSKDGVVKPTVVAPGEEIISASIVSDDAYIYMTGTSMSTPHVVGLIALLHNKRSDLSVIEVKRLLMTGGQATKPLGKSCGGISDRVYPNNHVGYGKISARATVDEM